MNPRPNTKTPTVTPLELHAPSPVMQESVAAVERIVNYDFKNNKKLLEEALTHPSCSNDAVSYKRLAFLGDAVLGLAVSNYLFHAYPEIDRGDLTQLRAANVSTERFARVAVRHAFYTYLRRTEDPVLDDRVREFTELVSGEEKRPVYGGSVEARKVLADIVESVAGAIYCDLNFDVEQLWMKFKHVLEPMVTLEEVRHQPHPVTEFAQLCQKYGMLPEIKYQRDGLEGTASVYVDGKFIVSVSAEQKEIARVNAAEMGLCKLMQMVCVDDPSVEVTARSKDELYKLCAKKNWPKPIYNIEHEKGPPHVKKFVSKVTIGGVCETGDAESRKKRAENSAASFMIRRLQDSDTPEVEKQSESMASQGTPPFQHGYFALTALELYAPRPSPE